MLIIIHLLNYVNLKSSANLLMLVASTVLVLEYGRCRTGRTGGGPISEQVRSDGLAGRSEQRSDRTATLCVPYVGSAPSILWYFQVSDLVLWPDTKYYYYRR